MDQQVDWHDWPTMPIMYCPCPYQHNWLGWNIRAGQCTAHALMNRIGQDEIYRLARTYTTKLYVGQL